VRGRRGRPGRHRARRRPRRRPLRAAPAPGRCAGARGRLGGRRAESAVQAVARHRPAVFVLDLERPGDISSLDTIRAVAQVSPETAVMVLLTKEDARFVRHAMHAGAVACVLEDTPSDELVEAVRRAANLMTAAMPREPGPPPDDLTQREFDVLRLLALGHTNAEIAARCISRCARSRPTGRACNRSWVARAAPSSCGTRSTAACSKEPRTVRAASGTWGRAHRFGRCPT
jgi:FixJ family two-component response regulator